MIVISLSICFSYALLILLTLYLDPKRKAGQRGQQYTMLHLLFFSSVKMLLVIGLVIATAAITGTLQDVVIGFSAVTFNWQTLGFGVIAAFGFVVIYSFWQAIVSRVAAKIRSDETTSHLVRLLPKKWLPLIGLFLLISLEAGLLEEIFFRGIIQAHGTMFLPVLWAAVLGGVLFGIAHFYQGIPGVIGTSALGVWLGITYAVGGNILVPVIGHFLGDFACMMLGARSIVEHNDS
jgi:membrane protease YdiL (CAAX protease family)